MPMAVPPLNAGAAVVPGPGDRPAQDRADQASRALADSRASRARHLEYVDWFNHRRLYEACGDIPPAELETAYYRHNAVLTEAGQTTT
jgi:transposase InsO family protein